MADGVGICLACEEVGFGHVRCAEEVAGKLQALNTYLDLLTDTDSRGWAGFLIQFESTSDRPQSPGLEPQAILPLATPWY